MARSNAFGAAFAGTAPKTQPAANSTLGILSEASRREQTGERIMMVSTAMIIENELNRKIYDVDSLDSLADDIAARGIQEPLILMPASNGRYKIVSGHRRYAASKLAEKRDPRYDGSRVPCVIRGDVTTLVQEEEAIILNNLQRDKTDYNRMMEIVTMQECAEARRAGGEEIPNLREYVAKRLGASNSEVQRYLMIKARLIPDAMGYFHCQSMATNVAHELSRLSEDCQKYIIQETEKTGEIEALTLPVVTQLAAKYEQLKNEAEQPELPDAPAGRRKTDVITDLSAGTAMIRSEYEKLDSLQSAMEKLKTRDRKKVLRIANKLYDDLAALNSILQNYRDDQTV